MVPVVLVPLDQGARSFGPLDQETRSFGPRPGQRAVDGLIWIAG